MANIERKIARDSKGMSEIELAIRDKIFHGDRVIASQHVAFLLSELERIRGYIQDETRLKELIANKRIQLERLAEDEKWLQAQIRKALSKDKDSGG